MTHSFQSPAEAARRTLLIVDDEVSIREIIVLVLEQAGYRCLQAENGQEALEIFRQHQSELGGIITDVNMPELNGISLVREIRNIAPDFKIILSSGSLGVAEKRIAADLGVSAFIAKPWNAKQLLSCVTSTFESKEDLVGVECESGAE
jgi:two-component system cell cycle sensor histidine kinase/response regulator CckA